MLLEKEIQKARKKIVADGYEMSVGEIMNLYDNKEIIINPDFQRLFRWDLSRKTRFIESILLGIPTPPVFVYQDEDGVWELIDGLQRLSTIFEFSGILRTGKGKTEVPSTLEGTKLLPSLINKRWEASSAKAQDGIGRNQQLQIKRARIRVEILKHESDPGAKYELFQRLNTGGVELSEQEVRNCIAVMLNKPFFEWLKSCASSQEFLNTIDQTDYAIEKQFDIELVLRFVTFRNVPYQKGLDVHEYLDQALYDIATSKNLDLKAERDIFDRTFSLLSRLRGKKAFKRWNGATFLGKFLLSVFEVVAIGVSKNIDRIEAMPNEKQKQFIIQRSKDLWSDKTFIRNSGAGVRGTTRLTYLLPMAESFFKL